MGPEGTPRPNQKERRRDDVVVSADDLLRLDVPGGRITEAGVRLNVSVALQYLDAWLRGSGAVAINNLMEDAATAEISRAQLWQWLRHGAATDAGPFTRARYEAIAGEELAKLVEARGAGNEGRLADAAGLLDALVLAEEFVEFLTLPAYPLLDAAGASGAP